MKLQIKKAMYRANKEANWWIGLWKTSSSNSSWTWLEGPPHLASLVMWVAVDSYLESIKVYF